MAVYTSVPTTSDSTPHFSPSSRDKFLPSPPASASASSSRPRARHDRRPPSKRRAALLALAAVAALAGLATLSRNEVVGQRVRGMVVDRVGYDARGRPVVDFEAEEVPEAFRCNPFKEAGRLAVDVENPVGCDPTVRISRRCADVFISMARRGRLCGGRTTRRARLRS